MGGMRRNVPVTAGCGGLFGFHSGSSPPHACSLHLRVLLHHPAQLPSDSEAETHWSEWKRGEYDGMSPGQLQLGLRNTGNLQLGQHVRGIRFFLQ